MSEKTNVSTTIYIFIYVLLCTKWMKWTCTGQLFSLASSSSEATDGFLLIFRLLSGGLIDSCRSKQDIQLVLFYLNVKSDCHFPQQNLIIYETRTTHKAWTWARLYTTSRRLVKWFQPSRGIILFASSRYNSEDWFSKSLKSLIHFAHNT